MENASKALLIAGSILVSLLIISLLVWGYRGISDWQQTKNNAEDDTKLSEYMLEFRRYDRTLYGSELFSLANLQEDYNADDDIQDGYKEIEISVSIKKGIVASNYFQAGTYTIEQINEQKEKLEKERNGYENKKYNGKSVVYYSQKTPREIANDFGIEYASTEMTSDIQYKLETNSKTKQLMQDIQKYENLNSIYNEFRQGKRFKCTNIEYDDANGRIIEMRYEEL